MRLYLNFIIIGNDIIYDLIIYYKIMCIYLYKKCIKWNVVWKNTCTLRFLVLDLVLTDNVNSFKSEMCPRERSHAMGTRVAHDTHVEWRTRGAFAYDMLSFVIYDICWW